MHAPFPYLPKQKRADLEGPARSMHSLRREMYYSSMPPNFASSSEAAAQEGQLQYLAPASLRASCASSIFTAASSPIISFAGPWANAITPSIVVGRPSRKSSSLVVAAPTAASLLSAATASFQAAAASLVSYLLVSAVARMPARSATQSNSSFSMMNLLGCAYIPADIIGRRQCNPSYRPKKTEGDMPSRVFGNRQKPFPEQLALPCTTPLSPCRSCKARREPDSRFQPSCPP